MFHKKRNLYGFNWAKEHIVAADEAIVVEGYTDAIACWEAGIKNVVATLGTALTEHHVKTLTRFAKRIVYLFDGDAAGQKAAERAIQFVETGSVDLRCVILPDDLDPADFLRDRSGEDLRAMLDAAEPLLDFVFRKLEGRSDVTTPAGRARALEDACRLIYPLRTSYMIDTYYMQIADRLGADPDMVREAATRVFRQVAREEETARNRERMRDRAQRDRSAATAPTPATRSAAAPGGGEPWGSEPFDEEPYDYVPMEADGERVHPFPRNLQLPPRPRHPSPSSSDARSPASASCCACSPRIRTASAPLPSASPRSTGSIRGTRP